MRDTLKVILDDLSASCMMAYRRDLQLPTMVSQRVAMLHQKKPRAKEELNMTKNEMKQMITWYEDQMDHFTEGELDSIRYTYVHM